MQNCFFLHFGYALTHFFTVSENMVVNELKLEYMAVRIQCVEFFPKFF